MDFKTRFKLLKDPDLWKTPAKKEEADMKKRVDALHRSYDAVKNLGFKGSYTSFTKMIGAVHKPSFYIPRIWKWNRHSQANWQITKTKGLTDITRA